MSEPSFPPYNVGDLAPGERRAAPAAARNVAPIGDTLAQWLPPSGVVLEIASGTGEHALAFARRFPALDWQPSDPDPLALASIAAWATGGPANLRPPLALDVTEAWPVERADAVLNVNMVHISPVEASFALVGGAARALPAGAPLILYGPWLERDVAPAASNRAFDQSLRERDSRWGLREVEWFAGLAAERGLALVERRAMPAHNLMLLFRRG
ncbi:DUF938 domain-containing protein [Sphingomonas sp. ASV193]|uniref:DUF938 domain-containing protein n=1 Tax=Sphingomonas sp. ASV193 TaxID=3144405 RepID=UPI0032E8C98B